MRIIKLSPSDPDMPSIEAVHEYFNEKLANREPQGRFSLTKGKIKPDGLSIGELVVFTYKAQLVYIAMVSQEVTPNADSDKEDYPSYFCIDLATLIPCTDSLKEFNRQLIEKKVTNKNFGGQGWVQVPDAEENSVVESLLKVFTTDSQNPLVTSKISEIVVRVGQQKFRNNLKSMWGCCAITGLDVERLLVASHIKPWKDSNGIEKLDRYNGFLLAPHLDAAFDNGFITFDTKGKIQISQALLGQEKALGICSSMKLSMITLEHEVYLTWHRNKIFRDKKT
jgi:hypothetical protein